MAAAAVASAAAVVVAVVVVGAALPGGSGTEGVVHRRGRAALDGVPREGL